MSTFAEIALSPGGIIAWLVMGFIAGWLAGLVMKGGGYGIVVDIIIGLVGAVIGGYVFGLLDIGGLGFLGSMVVAFLGACLLIMIVRFAAGARSRL
jgi:uncharacterized membrane protein YeaQ/YmgE (transglycosylase-associated protein family)